jgi:hypothetical protein
VGGVAPGSFVPKPERKRKREEGPTRVLERRKGRGVQSQWSVEEGEGNRAVVMRSGDAHGRPATAGAGQVTWCVGAGDEGGGPVRVGCSWVVAVGRPEGVVTFLLYSNSFQQN